MIEWFEITWKVSGLLPEPLDLNSKYYQETNDLNYSQRIFGRKDLDIRSSSLVPTRLFHQALSSELAKNHGLRLKALSQPYELPILDLGTFPIALRFRVFGSAFLVLSIRLPIISCPISITRLIQLQLLSSHPTLESIARFCFNVHCCPSPSQTMVKAWYAKPVTRVGAIITKITNSDLAAIVTRHDGLNERATQELIAKNETLNFDNNLIFLDKQGAISLTTTAERNNQRNRFKRICSLYEYALFVCSTIDVLDEGNKYNVGRILPTIENIKSTLTADVLSQSVSARRGWELIKTELGLDRINLASTPQLTKNRISKKRVMFYDHPVFLGLSALVVFIASIVTIILFFR